MIHLIALHFENLRLFIAQYIVATIGGILIYYYLGIRRFQTGTPIPVLRKVKFAGQSEFFTPLKRPVNNTYPVMLLQPGLFNDSLISFWNTGRLFADLTYFFRCNGYPNSTYQSLASIYTGTQPYESSTMYGIYRIMVAVIGWTGILLLITPFKYIYVFLPHFPPPFDIIVAIVLTITIFEGMLSTVFFRIGTSFVRIALVESLVITVFTFSLLTPSMSWISTFTMQGRIDIYLILLAMFVAITALISQLKTKRNLFLSSLAFSAIAYASFVGIVLYNVLQFL